MISWRGRLFSICMIATLFCALAGGPSARGALPAPPSAASDATRVLEVHFQNLVDLQRAAARLDIWQVDRKQNTFVAAVTPAQEAWLLENGFTFKARPDLSAHPAPQALEKCYRTVSQLYADLQARQAAYPNLLSLLNIGKSYDGQDLWVARVTNRLIQADKPRLFIMANIHGRELITPETAFAFLDNLLQKYGSDPDWTALVDWQETDILVTANPDGHVKTEQGVIYDGWRKNTHPYGICAASNIGVDLNRNYSFHWGLGAGSTSFPCDQIYHGPSPASEPETQAVETYLRSIFPDRRGPANNDPAPADASGLMVTLHSFGNLVLWPWGSTGMPTPNGAALTALGVKMAAINNFTPIQSYELYPTDGTTDEWAYGELGLAAYTYEIGSGYDGFFPACSQVTDLIQPNVAALLLAARSAYLPYQAGLGPDVVSADIAPTQPFTVTAAIQGSASHIQAAAAYLDIPPWAGGSPFEMVPLDGFLGAFTETVQGNLSFFNLPVGNHLVWLHAQASDGSWGPFKVFFLPVRSQIYLPVVSSGAP